MNANDIEKEKKKQEVPIWEKLMLTPEEASESVSYTHLRAHET